jgi:hypothetical protein
MNRRSIFSLSAITALGLALLPGSTVAQQKTLKEQLVGTWSFVSSTSKVADGSPSWGANPKGLQVYAENGRFSSMAMRSDLPKFASNNRERGTPDENRAIVVGTNSRFGTYSVNEANKTVTIRIEGSSYPNEEGTETTRPITITGEELRYTNPAPTVGGPPTQLIWRRGK